jgi:hypothetical protein
MNPLIKKAIHFFVQNDVVTKLESTGMLQSVNIADNIPVNDYFDIEDNGAPVSIFSFAGGAAMYAGMPQFEFKKVICSNTNNLKKFNYVFVRDIKRMGYHISPNGEKTGLTFFEQKIKDIIKSLGSTYHIFIGSSQGGSAAMYFGVRCNIEKVIVFNPLVDQLRYVSSIFVTDVLFNKNILMDFKHYSARLLFLLFSISVINRMTRVLKRENIWNIVKEYQTATQRPKTVIFYSRLSKADNDQASQMDFPETKRIGIDYNLHYLPKYLKGLGKLDTLIQSEINEAPDSLTHFFPTALDTTRTF